MVEVSAGRITVRTLTRMYERREPLAMVTAYDAPTAYWAERAGVDILLVGDSVGSVVLGYETTVPVTIEMILHHTRAVVRGSRRALVVADVPFLVAHFSLDRLLDCIGPLLQDAGAVAVKIEGGSSEIVHKISCIVKAGIPTMGHIGLLPQTVHCLGGYCVVGREEDSADRLLKEASSLAKAGVFALVLECVPESLAKRIAEQSPIPVIGIGSGRYCHGQVLVLHDLLGMTMGCVPSFVRTYAHIGQAMEEGIRLYVEDVKAGRFPAAKHTFPITVTREASAATDKDGT
ncbi:3-methyl-2-oxobutanoate hydroxymethyltransferase [Pasteuria penetrans]|uniref:3-methyl-2-oxobutanoate hydroxymethyltransferase n=1 Tax=Pasteuria penetrans TaxID=86005 RepID=UPI000F97A2E5|nr:3-methyl-2-oxobutanoate hydroxymethyltransferase [Pasteuria penetrans]